MKAQVSGPEASYEFFVTFDTQDEGKDIWIDNDDLIDFTEEEVKLIKEYRALRSRYRTLCREKKDEQDKKVYGCL